MQTLMESNFLLIAAKAYINPSCTDVSEFYQDLEKIKHIKKIINRYQKSGKINLRLLVNHFVCLYNVFEGKCLTQILCYSLTEELAYVKPILEYLGHWSDIIGPFEADHKYIKGSAIESNPSMIKELGTI